MGRVGSRGSLARPLQSGLVAVVVSGLTDSLFQTPSAGAYDVVVIGAGASGLMRSMQGGRSARYWSREGPKPGLKILVSGGGRCNFTNMWAEPTDHYLSAVTLLHFRHATLFTMGFYRHGQSPWYRLPRKKLGQLFCDHSAQDIVDMLVAEAADAV